jgi:hypothetical protein
MAQAKKVYSVEYIKKKETARLTDKDVSPRTNCRAVAKSTIENVNKTGAQY